MQTFLSPLNLDPRVVDLWEGFGVPEKPLCRAAIPGVKVSGWLDGWLAGYLRQESVISHYEGKGNGEETRGKKSTTAGTVNTQMPHTECPKTRS